ncbi:hypothetical protein ACFSJW_01930 [Flavobacterium artemisiae]|uniref:Uncharacterized protein n=1 Tax=Flavobacterium artemisiae TaxID=2126556 RepID=A0ABW4HIE5_9FLAO
MSTSNNKKSTGSAKASDKKTDKKETASKSTDKTAYTKKDAADTKKGTDKK